MLLGLAMGTAVALWEAILSSSINVTPEIVPSLGVPSIAPNFTAPGTRHNDGQLHQDKCKYTC